MKRLAILFVSCSLLLGTTAAAQTPATPAATLPEWDQLTPQQREVLVAPLRDRWNSDAGSRQRMLDHAQRWKDMSPQQREQARKGMRRFERMNPEQREQARALFMRMRGMPPEQREQLRQQWKQMTPEQRQRWMDENRPPEGPPPPR